MEVNVKQCTWDGDEVDMAVSVVSDDLDFSAGTFYDMKLTAADTEIKCEITSGSVLSSLC